MRHEVLLFCMLVALVALNGLTAFLLFRNARRQSLLGETLVEMRRLRDALSGLSHEAEEVKRAAEVLKSSVVQLRRPDVDEVERHRVKLLGDQEDQQHRAALIQDRMLQATETWGSLGQEISQQLRHVQELFRHQEQTAHAFANTTEALYSIGPEISGQLRRSEELFRYQEQTLHAFAKTIDALSIRLEQLVQTSRETGEVAFLQNAARDDSKLARLSASQEALGDLVRFSVFAPPMVRRGMSFILNLWAYLETQQKEMLQRAEAKGRAEEGGTVGPFAVEAGTELLVVLELSGFTIDHPASRLLWAGQIANISFSVRAGGDLGGGLHSGCATILRAGVPLAHLYFEIEVGEECSRPAKLRGGQRTIRSVFASYAEEDRADVLQWSRGAQDVGVDVFVDVLKLRNGQHWEQELWREIPSRDLFCLFWSAPASRSAWVEKEWRCALATRGADYVHPVPLADPRDVPAPPELSGLKHFNDLTRIVLEYERSRKSPSGDKT